MTYNFEQFKKEQKMLGKEYVINLIAYNKEKNLCLCDIEGGYKIQVCSLPVLLRDVFNGICYVNYYEKLQCAENWNVLEDLEYEDELEKKRFIDVSNLIKKSGFDNEEVFRHIEIMSNCALKCLDSAVVNKVHHKELTDFEKAQIGFMFCGCLMRHLLQSEFSSKNTYKEGLNLLEDLYEVSGEDSEITDDDFLAQWLKISIENKAFQKNWNGTISPVYEILPENVDIQTEINMIASFVAMLDDSLETSGEVKKFLCSQFDGESYEDGIVFEFITSNVIKEIFKRYKKIVNS